MTKRFCDKCGAEALGNSGYCLRVDWVMGDGTKARIGKSAEPAKIYDLCAKCEDAIKEALPG